MPTAPLAAPLLYAIMSNDDNGRLNSSLFSAATSSNNRGRLILVIRLLVIDVAWMLLRVWLRDVCDELDHLAPCRRVPSFNSYKFLAPYAQLFL